MCKTEAEFTGLEKLHAIYCDFPQFCDVITASVVCTVETQPNALLAAFHSTTEIQEKRKKKPITYQVSTDLVDSLLHIFHVDSNGLCNQCEICISFISLDTHAIDHMAQIFTNADLRSMLQDKNKCLSPVPLNKFDSSDSAHFAIRPTYKMLVFFNWYGHRGFIFINPFK